jgi:hypothetical protein
MKKIFVAIAFLALSAQLTEAQNTVESIRKEYQDVHEWIGHMMPNDEGMTGMPPEYFDLHVVQNLPATGPHREDIRMFYNDVENDEESEDWTPYPDHWLRFVTAKYNFAAREFYEEYLYDNKGQVMFIYAISPDVGDNVLPYELRMWFNGKKLLRFTAKKADLAEGEYIDGIANLKYKEEYSGANIPEFYEREACRCQQRAQRFLEMFKGIDKNTYL